jgi:hypothetical protein
VILCAVCTMLEETRSAGSLLSHKTKVDCLSVVWPQNYRDGLSVVWPQNHRDGLSLVWPQNHWYGLSVVWP